MGSGSDAAEVGWRVLEAGPTCMVMFGEHQLGKRNVVKFLEMRIDKAVLGKLRELMTVLGMMMA